MMRNPVAIKFSDDERAEITAKAEADGLAFGTWLRVLGLAVARGKIAIPQTFTLVLDGQSRSQDEAKVKVEKTVKSRSEQKPRSKKERKPGSKQKSR